MFLRAGINPLSENQLRAVAPSVFAENPWQGMSDKYVFVPTIEIVRRLAADGFAPVCASQSRTRIVGKEDFVKHQVRFRDVRAGNTPVLTHLGQLFAELVLTNSHDGGSAFVMDAGLLRLACFNGMVVSDSTIESKRIRHQGAADAVIEASYRVVDELPRVLDQVEGFSRVALDSAERSMFAAAALSLRYDDGKSPVQAESLLKPRRREDTGKVDLFTSMNVIQEHLTKGGLQGRVRGSDGRTRRQSVRAVNGISEDTKLNKAIWALTEHMAQLKGGALGCEV